MISYTVQHTATGELLHLSRRPFSVEAVCGWEPAGERHTILSPLPETRAPLCGRCGEVERG